MAGLGSEGAVESPRWARRPGLWLGLLAAAAAFGFWLWQARGPQVRTLSPVRRDLEQHVVASGRVRVPVRIQVASQLSGLVVAVTAAEGRRVQAGELLIQIDDAEARAAAAQAQAGVAQARARVAQLERVGTIVAAEALREADTNLEQAEAELGRSAELVAKGALPQRELDDARRAVQRAQAQRSAAEAQRVASTPVGTDSRIALTALLEAQARAAGAEARLAQTRLLAPAAGTVLSRAVEPGDLAQPGQTLLVLAADAQTELVFEADERNLPFLATGQAAMAAADAYPERSFSARVSFIAPAIDPQRGSVEVQLSVEQPPEFLKPDMTVSVDLTTARRAGVLTLPSEAVRGITTSAPWVLVVEDGHVRRRSISLGLRGDGAVEVLRGVTPGAAVVPPSERGVTEGQRVRPLAEGS